MFLANDILIFRESNKEALPNLRCILMGFQVVSGLSIDLAKSALIYLGETENPIGLAKVMDCKVADLPIKFWVCL